MILGVIADDFTGASDAASFLVKGGLKTLLVNGVPKEEPSGMQTAEAVVVALKTRTQETGAAVRDSLAAARWLTEHGAQHLYSKYCSTFDSTKDGNIGPIADALMEAYDVPYTLLCPALPVNGRTVKDGCLYVHGVPLAESSMKDHPLTPMRESKISKLMESQSKYPVFDLPSGAEKAPVQMQEAVAARGHAYLVPDYVEDADGEAIVRQFGDQKLLTGGSGLLEPWAKRLSHGSKATAVETRMRGGRALLLAGSCSQATLGQIRCFQEHGGISFKISPEALLDGTQDVGGVMEQIRQQDGRPVLIYSSETPEYLDGIRGDKLAEYSAVLEQTMAELARRAVDEGFTQIIVAGGETSGAVTKALGYASYWIGESVAPGVPVMMPSEQTDVRLVLKSGNFGQPDFFHRALDKSGGNK